MIGYLELRVILGFIIVYCLIAKLLYKIFKEQ